MAIQLDRETGRSTEREKESERTNTFRSFLWCLVAPFRLLGEDICSQVLGKANTKNLKFVKKNKKYRDWFEFDLIETKWRINLKGTYQLDELQPLNYLVRVKWTRIYLKESNANDNSGYNYHISLHPFFTSEEAAFIVDNSCHVIILKKRPKTTSTSTQLTLNENVNQQQATPKPPDY